MQSPGWRYNLSGTKFVMEMIPPTDLTIDLMIMMAKVQAVPAAESYFKITGSKEFINKPMAIIKKKRWSYMAKL